jgi:hypothetical protein
MRRYKRPRGEQGLNNSLRDLQVRKLTSLPQGRPVDQLIFLFTLSFQSNGIPVAVKGEMTQQLGNNSLCGRGREFVERIYWLRQVPWPEYNIIRAGVIPYVVINNHVMLALGVDKQSQELTDFGGGVRDNDVDPIAAALREFREESKGVFGEENYSRDNYTNSFCLIKQFSWRNQPNRHMMIILQQVDESYLIRSEDAFVAQAASAKDEVSAIQWCSEGMFRELVYTPQVTRMYTRVKRFIANCISFGRLIYWLKVRGGMEAQNPNFGSQLQLKTVSSTDSAPWLEEPKCFFKRRRGSERRPHLNLTSHTVTQCC